MMTSTIFALELLQLLCSAQQCCYIGLTNKISKSSKSHFCKFYFYHFCQGYGFQQQFLIILCGSYHTSTHLFVFLMIIFGIIELIIQIWRHAQTHTSLCTHSCTCTHTSTHTHKHTQTHTHTYPHMHTHTHI